VIGLEVQSRKPGVEQLVVEDIELTAMRQAAHNIPPYQRLLSAALRGEHDLFASQETIEQAWRIVDPTLGNATPVHDYERGSWGPAEADRLAPAPGWYAPRIGSQVVTHPPDGGSA
jgi:glucose-6-phosphate 1-dehydrogenase